jgi:hypothetical protein
MKVSFLFCVSILNYLVTTGQDIRKTVIGEEIFYTFLINRNTLMLSNNCSAGFLNSNNKVYIAYVDLYLRKMDTIQNRQDTSFSCVSLVDSFLIKKILKNIEAKESIKEKTVLLFSYLNSNEEYIFLLNIFRKKNFRKFIKNPFSKKTKWSQSAKENIQILEINVNKFSNQYLVFRHLDKFEIFKL